MAKPAPAIKTEAPQQSFPVSVPDEPEVFVRLRRKEGGWIVKVVHVAGDRVVKAFDHYEWDMYQMTESRALTLAQATQQAEDERAAKAHDEKVRQK